MVDEFGGTTLIMTMHASPQREARPMLVRAAPLVAERVALAALLRCFGAPTL
jgi:hypothetical protein